MVTLSGFADEIGPDLDEQIKTLSDEGIKFLELRGVWNTPVLGLSDEQKREMKKRLSDAGIGVSAIGSPIGKVRIDDDYSKHLDDFRIALDLADFFETPNIRLFSYYPPEGKHIGDYRDEVLRRMAQKTEIAEERGIILLHENEHAIYGETPERCREIAQTVDSPNLRLIFDPANFILAGIKPYTDAWPLMCDDVVYFHIKDGTTDGKVVPAGEGDGEVPEVLGAAAKRGFEGFLSLEPHLKHAKQFGGFSGPELFKKAARALKAILEKLGVEYQ